MPAALAYRSAGQLWIRKGDVVRNRNTHRDSPMVASLIRVRAERRKPKVSGRTYGERSLKLVKLQDRMRDGVSGVLARKCT